MRSLQPLNNDWGFYVNNKQDFHRSNQHQRFFIPNHLLRSHASLNFLQSIKLNILLFSVCSIRFTSFVSISFLFLEFEFRIFDRFNRSRVYHITHQSSLLFIWFTSIFDCFYLFHINLQLLLSVKFNCRSEFCLITALPVQFSPI